MLNKPAMLVDCRNGTLEEIGDEASCNAAMASVWALYGDASQRPRDFRLVTLYDKGLTPDAVSRLIRTVTRANRTAELESLFKLFSSKPEQALDVLVRKAYTN